jgi:hypothetical protein
MCDMQRRPGCTMSHGPLPRAKCPLCGKVVRVVGSMRPGPINRERRPPAGEPWCGVFGRHTKPVARGYYASRCSGSMTCVRPEDLVERLSDDSQDVG